MVEEELIVLHGNNHSSNDILFSNLDGYGRRFGILGFDGRFRVGTRTGSRSWIYRLGSTTGHKEEGH